MVLTIYGTAKSRAARVLWMAKELGLEFEHIPLSINDAALKQPQFLKINPAGRIPAIDDAGFTLSESLAINLYLARKYGDRAKPSLAPASLEEEAKIWQCSAWAMTDLEGPMSTLYLHRCFFPPERRDAKVADAAEAQVQRPLAMLNSGLAERSYLVGERFSVADLNVACVLSPTRLSVTDLSAYPKLADWAKRCHDRPASVAARSTLP